MHEVRPQHFAVAIGVEDLAGLLDREGGLVLDPRTALWVPLELRSELAHESILIVALSLDLQAASRLKRLKQPVIRDLLHGWLKASPSSSLTGLLVIDLIRSLVD